MTKTFFLPGAGGSASFWRPVADLTQFVSVLLAWPGLGNELPAPGIDELDDLVSMVLNQINEPANLAAQSIGGLIAIKVALQEPEKVRRLVLVATSAGIPVKELGGSDWQSDYYRAFPHAAAWVGRIHCDRRNNHLWPMQCQRPDRNAADGEMAIAQCS
jgi:pimeloyl-ACP methyl ester carboxylesterase